MLVRFNPNGLACSPDETVLYINHSRRRHIRAFDLAPNGTLARQTDRVFAELGGTESGVPDGMKVDSAGNVYCGGSGGLDGEEGSAGYYGPADVQSSVVSKAIDVPLRLTERLAMLVPPAL